MPKIEIKERDLTTNNPIGSTTNIIFVADNAEGVPSQPTLARDLLKLLETSDSSGSSEIEFKGFSPDNDLFIQKALNLGGIVYVCDSYKNAADYISDRNAFDVKFLLVNELSDDDPKFEDVDYKSDLEYALQIAQKRKDCAVVLSTLKTQVQNKTFALVNADLNYLEGFYQDEVRTKAGKYVLPYYGTLDLYSAGQGYILAYLNSIMKGNAEWLAIAGSQRGYIPGAVTAGLIKESDLDAMQPREYYADKKGVAVNPIYNVTPWGVRIWGARTALPNNSLEYDHSLDQLVASSFANIRILICDLKKALYKAAKKYQFEQNNDILYVNFTSEVNGLLEQMVQSYGIAGYRWFREDAKERATVKARLAIVPVEPVEDFYLTLELDDELEVAE